MSESLLSAVMRFLSPEMVGKMATASGLDPSMAQKALAGAVPAILGGLSDVATQPGGARQLANAIAEQPAGILGGLAGALSGSGQLADQGNALFSNLLGSGTLSAIVSAVSRHVGIGEGPMRTLIGLLSPVIMGVMGRQQRAAGLDASGLARMLTGQKDDIAAAMPAGLASLLPQDIKPSFEAPRAMEGRAYDFPRGAYSGQRPPNGSMQRAVSDPGMETARATWPYWVLPLLAIGGLLWYLLPTDHTAPQPSEPTRMTTTPTSSMLVQRPGAQTRSTYLARAGDDVISIGVFTNQEVYNRGGERIGTVKDILIAPDGRISAAVLSVGQFLGIGEKNVAVPFSALMVERRNGGLRLSVDAVKEALQSAPSFDRAREGSPAIVPRLPASDAAPAQSGPAGATRQ